VPYSSLYGAEVFFVENKEKENFLPFGEAELEELLTYNRQVREARPKDAYGLTPRQKKYCDLRLQLKGITESYRAAFNSATENFQTIYSNAWKLEQLPKIQYYLEIKSKELAEKADITAQEIISGLAEEARNRDNKAADRIRAREILAKIKKLFADGNTNDNTVFIFNREFVRAAENKNE
jgi:hypothetical protein